MCTVHIQNRIEWDYRNIRIKFRFCYRLECWSQSFSLSVTERNGDPIHTVLTWEFLLRKLETIAF